MVYWGFEPGAAGWQAQTKPRSYGRHPVFVLHGCGLSINPTPTLQCCSGCYEVSNATPMPIYGLLTLTGSILVRSQICFSSSSAFMILKGQGIDGTQELRMIGVFGTTELWWPTIIKQNSVLYMIAQNLGIKRSCGRWLPRSLTLQMMTHTSL